MTLVLFHYRRLSVNGPFSTPKRRGVEHGSSHQGSYRVSTNPVFYHPPGGLRVIFPVRWLFREETVEDSWTGDYHFQTNFPWDTTVCELFPLPSSTGLADHTLVRPTSTYDGNDKGTLDLQVPKRSLLEQ